MPDDRLGVDLELVDLSKQYEDSLAVDRVNLSVAPGEFVTLLGPSGSGKTTTLNMIAGFVEPTSGRILLNGSDISNTPAHRREIGVVFQGYLLFPHMSVFRNVEYPLARRGIPKTERRRRVMEALEIVRLTRLAERFPRQLSGGEQQRVALARAIVFRPPLMLMDEPLGALDKKLRDSLQWEIKRIQRETGITCVYVTHDQEESLVLSDRIAIFRDGNIEQVGTPSDLYLTPASLFVATFVGESNCLSGTVVASGGRVSLDVSGHRVALPEGAVAPGTSALTLMIRPENLHVHRPHRPRPDSVLGGTVTQVTFLGPVCRLDVAVPGVGDLIVRQSITELLGVSAGDQVDVGWSVADGWPVPQDDVAATAMELDPDADSALAGSGGQASA